MARGQDTELDRERGMGRGRMGGFGLGPGGNCICPECGFKLPHLLGIPCNDNRCPQCGTIMERQETISPSIGETKETYI